MAGPAGQALDNFGQSINKGWNNLTNSNGGGNSYVNNTPTPNAPTYNPITDSTGQIEAQLRSHYNPDTTALNEIQKRGLETGPSAWAQQATANQGLDEAKLQNDTQQQGASAQAQAQSALASKYGLSPAAAERLATQNSRSTMNNLQNVGFQGAQARGQIGLQDQQMKNQFLNEVPQMQAQLASGQAQNEQFNAQNAIGQNNLYNNDSYQRYKDQMANWGAGQNATAMQNSGGGGKK